MRELKGLLARKSAGRPPGYKAYREIFLAEDHLEVTDISRGREGWHRHFLGALTLYIGDEAPALLLSRRNQPLVLALPAVKCFLHSVEVPKAALSRIDQFLGLELSRVTPFAASDVLTGWFETADAPGDTHATISQVIAKRSIVAPLLEELARWKIPVSGIFARSPEGDYLPPRLANPAVAIGDRGVGRWRRLAVAASVFAGLCALASMWTVFSRQASELEDLSQRTETAQKKAVEVRKRLALMESSSQRIVELKTAKLSGPSPLAIWEELTRLIPDTAWVSSLAIDKAQVTIEGNARSPEELITLLDASLLFEAVSFNAPVTKLPGNDLTRFVIRLALSRDQQLSSAAP
jgi:general secretion pathway protein L